MLYRRRDIKRLFAYSSIEHMGIITFAFGMGGPLANFAGLLHMTMHSLTKSAIFFAVGHIAQVKGTQKHRRHPRAHRQPSRARLDLRRSRVLAIAGLAAAGHLHERVPGRHLDHGAPAAGSPCRWCSGSSSASAPSSCGCRASPSATADARPCSGRGAACCRSGPHLALVAIAGLYICRRRWSPGSGTWRLSWAERHDHTTTARLSSWAPARSPITGPGRA